ncbi:MAG: CBS domain-containing protein [candidate division KSB1 bacterium]|nr:CBS domain-containing protein [candidate division KSB1 bacterium]
MKVKDILAAKGTHVVTINQEATVYEALETFAANRVGSLLVLDEKGGIVGIVAARDALMAVLRACDEIRKIKVKEIMTKNIIIGDPEDDLDSVEVIMTENRIRHLPIIKDNKLAGIVSIGDVVKAQLKNIHVENRYLKDYILGKYPA